MSGLASEVYQHFHVVTDEEIDALGHANNLAYVKWMQAAAMAHSDSVGWSTQRYLDAGAGWVVRSHYIEYLSPAYAGQEVVVRTWVAGFKKVTSLRRYEIVRPSDQVLLAKAETNWAFIGFEHRVPRRILPEIIESFGPLRADPSS